jgi:phenylacetate-CoA ligase
MQLIQKAEDMGSDFNRDFKLKKIVTTAEPLPLPLRQRFTDEYGLTVGNCYATAELGLLALDTAGAMAMRLMPEPIIQVVDPDSGKSVGPGEAGEVVVTNYGRAYPLIRFGTGDLAVKIDANPGASKQEERMIILVGRTGDAVKVRGMFVHPNQLRFAMSQVTSISAFQGIVTRPENRDILTIQVVLYEPADDPVALGEKLKAGIQAACRVRADEIEFVSAEAIPPGSPGMVDQRSWD